MTPSKLSKLNFPAVSSGLKKIAIIVLIVGFNFYWLSLIGQTSSYFSDTETGQVVVSVGVWGTPTPNPMPSPSGVVLNEFLPRPSNDSGPRPNGEWVELYNLSATETIDLAGYYLKDNLNPTSGPSHKIYVENCRTDTGGTVIEPHGFLVVYAKGDNGGCNSHGFELNNAGDTVRLFNNKDEMIDSYSYDGSVYCSLTPSPGEPNTDDSFGSCPGVVPKNKSFARIPDGTGPWYDPIPTPGEPNKLSEETVTQEVAGVASGSLNSPASASLGISGGGSVSQDTIVTNQGGMASPAPVSSESVEPLPESSPEASPEVTPEVTPEPASDDSSIQVLAEPVIPVEPVTPSADSGQAVEPPADPPAPEPAPEQAPAPAEAPAPAPAE